MQGINESVVRSLSEQKKEPLWMLDLRLKALKVFENAPTQTWGPSLSELSFDELHYYVKPKQFEEKHLDKEPVAGFGAQYESEMVYHSLKEEWEKQGIIFLDSSSGLKNHETLFKEYFGTVVPYTDNKFAALNTAVWSGGSFIYIPKGIIVSMPLQTFFRIESEQLGQFERTLIIVDEGAQLHYLEGCTAPWSTKSSLHCGVVEIIAKKNSRVRYSTIQNWSKNIYNLVTKRAIAYKNASVEWVFGSIGSKVTMEYPCVILKESGAKTDIFSIATATTDTQIQDSGGKAVHLAPNTSSRIISKSISNNGGIANYRGSVRVIETAHNCKSFVQCDALILDKKSKANAYPYIDVKGKQVQIAHEARVSKIEEEQIFYLMSRGLSKKQAEAAIVNGFLVDFVKELPTEYAIEMERLIEIELESKTSSDCRTCSDKETCSEMDPNEF